MDEDGKSSVAAAPGAFATPANLYRAAKKKIPTLKKKDVETWMNEENTRYIMTKPRAYSRFPRKLSTRFSYVTSAGFVFHMDTAQVTSRDFRYIYVGIDAFSK